MYGVGFVLLRKHFQNCIVLVKQGSFFCWRLCISLMGGFIGTFGSVVHHKIGSQICWIFFWVELYSRNVRGVGDNKLCWKPTMRRGFEVQGFYHSLSLSVIDFPRKMMWQSKVPPRVAFFSWTAALGKILTTDNLWKRHIIV